MEEVTTTGVPELLDEPKASPLRLILQALAFTGVLYLTSVLTLPKPKVTVYSPTLSTISSLENVKSTVLRDVSHHSGLPISVLKVVDVQQRTWTDDCLGIAQAEIACTKILIPGWHITVASGEQRWVYHTNLSGSMMRLQPEVFPTNEAGYTRDITSL